MCSNQLSYIAFSLLAGVEGFEPTHDGIKTRCLTAWLYPNRLTQKQFIQIDLLPLWRDIIHITR
jgi:hypothetical protein